MLMFAGKLPPAKVPPGGVSVGLGSKTGVGGPEPLPVVVPDPLPLVLPEPLPLPVLVPVAVPLPVEVPLLPDPDPVVVEGANSSGLK